MKIGPKLFTVLSILFMFFLASCVSTQEYNDLEAKNKRTEQDLASLKRENETAKTTIVDLEKQLEDLRVMSDELRAESEREIEALKRTYDSLEKSLKQEISNGKIQIEQAKGKLTMKVAEELFFDTGKAEIRPEGKAVWGIEHLHLPALWRRGYRGKGILVGHLDTGVDGGHPDRKDKISDFVRFDGDTPYVNVKIFFIESMLSNSRYHHYVIEVRIFPYSLNIFYEKFQKTGKRIYQNYPNRHRTLSRNICFQVMYVNLKTFLNAP